MTCKALLFTGALTLAAAAEGGQDAARAAQDKALAAPAPAVAQACGVPVAVRIDWATFQCAATAVVAGAGKSCSEGLRGLVQGCTADAGDRAAFQRLYKSFVCTYGGAGKRKITTGQGVITYAFDPAKGGADSVEGYVFGLIKD